jgi:ABC-type multidrug transport system ATPase subunit
MTSAALNIVEALGLTKRYANGVLAVDRLDLHVRHGEVYGFLGPNGAGKTTTLRMLLGLIRPTSGSATVAGVPPGAPAGLARIGALVENPGFYPYLSGRDNLRFVARMCGLPDRRADTALDEVGLMAKGNQKFATYSMGMKQRLGVAAALLKEPELLVLDEPSNGLDPEGMVEMRGMIRNLGQGERTVLLSSHLLNEIEHICQRVGVIQHGRLIAEGTLDELKGSVGLTLRAAPEAQAREVLVRLLGAPAVVEQAGAFRLSVEPARAGEINTLLVKAGIVVSELRPSEHSLEEIFLQLTHEVAP